LEKWNSSKGH